MKKSAMVLVIVLAAAIGAGCSTQKPAEPAAPNAPALSGPKKRVGVFEFENKSRYGQNRLSSAAVDVLYSELAQADVFVLYERADLDQLGKEFDLINSGVVNLDTAAEAGKLVGVQAVIVGTITQFGMWEEAKDIGVYKKKVEIAEATVDVRVVDVTTGRVIYADSGTGRTERELQTVLGFGQKATFDETMADKALRAAMQQFTGKLIAEIVKLPWQGYVMDVDTGPGGAVLYINAGRTSGMPVGQKLVVKRVMGKLTDPVTGEFKGYKTADLGAAEVYELSGEDVSLARLTAGSGVKRGDMVTLAP